MVVLANVFIGITALLHIMFFKVESLDFMKPQVLKRFGLDASSGAIAKVWAFNQGFYNLFLAFGLFYALFLLNKGNIEGGTPLATVILATIIGAGIVLYLSAPQNSTAAKIQTLPALLALIFLKLAFKS